MVKLSDTFLNIKSELEQGDVESADFEARCIFEDVFGIKFKRFELDSIQASDNQLNQLSQMVKRRILGEPLQYILGEWEFYGLKFFVGKGVLIPRQDTETLVDFAINKLKAIPSPTVLDLCSGSGCIGISIEKNIENASISAVEISSDALAYLKKNCAFHKSKINVFHASVLEKSTYSQFSDVDMIVSNPPYLTQRDMENLQKEVQFEPEISLYGSDDGLHFYRQISQGWKNSLKIGGIIAFEVGLNQHRDVMKILSDLGYKDVGFVPDLTGIERVVFGTR